MCQNNYRVLFLSLLCGFLISMDSQAEIVRDKESACLIVPARLRIIQMAFDLTRLRSVNVVAYRGPADSKEPVLYWWTGSEWRYVSIDDFCENRVLKINPSRIVFIGDSQILPSVLVECVTWCSDVEIIETLNIADLINSFDRWFKFSSREWKWLARRCKLTLVDTNAERRAFNPYNVKRSELPLTTKEFNTEKDEPAPAVVIEEKQEEIVIEEKQEKEPVDKTEDKSAETSPTE